MLSRIVLIFSKESLRTEKEKDSKYSPFLDISGMKCFNVSVEIILKFSTVSCFDHVERKCFAPKPIIACIF